MINKKQGAGFTLLELMLVVAIAGILASIAVPSFSKMIERNRLKEAAEGLKSDLMWMRTEAIKQSCSLSANFDKDAWNYVIYQPAGTCICPAGANCNLKSVTSNQFQGITMSSAAFGGTTTAEFDFRRGTAGSSANKFGGATLASTSYRLRVVVSKSGRVRICYPADSPNAVIGYKGC